MSELDTRGIRRRQQYEMTAAERRGLRHIPPLISRDVPALCDEVDRLRAEVEHLTSERDYFERRIEEFEDVPS